MASRRIGRDLSRAEKKRWRPYRLLSWLLGGLCLESDQFRQDAGCFKDFCGRRKERQRIHCGSDTVSTRLIPVPQATWPRARTTSPQNPDAETIFGTQSSRTQSLANGRGQGSLAKAT